uniref:Skp1 domain-containing protein n=1 Tax=Caenorhabditis tropicalis TaxID=1561998 RepID=A0A1I7U204_9PELO
MGRADSSQSNTTTTGSVIKEELMIQNQWNKKDARKFGTRNSLEDYLTGPTFRTPEYLKLCLEYGVEDAELQEVWEEEFIQHEEEDYLAGPTFRTPEYLKLCVEYGVENGDKVFIQREEEEDDDEKKK